jgi:hypothetical protein
MVRGCRSGNATNTTITASKNMATPTQKSPQINRLLSSLLGVDREQTINADACVFCSQPATEFKNEISRREFAISGICQKCQDETFS